MIATVYCIILCIYVCLNVDYMSKKVIIMSGI